MKPDTDGYVTDATLVIHGAGAMSSEGRRILAGWLRQQAKHLLKEGHNYAARFRARYRHRPKKRQKACE